MKSAAAIIVAAGSGTRMGRPKQFLPLFGQPVVQWSIDAFLGMPEIKQLVLVTSPEDLKKYGESLRGDRVILVEGGATRMESLRKGFAKIGPDVELVAVHDGARPLITAKIVRETLEAAQRHGASVAAVPAKDTLKRVEDEDLWVIDTPERSNYWQAQTPQSYRREILEKALANTASSEDMTDESQLVERLGQKVKIVPSTYENIKITTPDDLVVASAMLSARAGTPHRAVSRTGFGYDIHRLVEGRSLWLAGVEIPHNKGLKGHSDGDVVLHACCDAILGAMGEGEIGIAFPPGDPRFKGIASRKIAAHVLAKLKERGGKIVHLDATVVAEEPKLKPHYETLLQSLAESFRLETSRVNFKAKTNEGLGEIGRGEAISCYAVASVALPD